MMQVLKEALKIYDQDRVKSINDDSLSWLFFTPQGRRYCSQHNFPLVDRFRQLKENASRLGVYVDVGEIDLTADHPNIVLIGSTKAIVSVTDNTKVHRIILMHGAKAKILASNYTVILLANIGSCQIEIEKDDTVLVF